MTPFKILGTIAVGAIGGLLVSFVTYGLWNWFAKCTGLCKMPCDGVGTIAGLTAALIIVASAIHYMAENS